MSLRNSFPENDDRETMEPNISTSQTAPPLALSPFGVTGTALDVIVVAPVPLLRRRRLCQFCAQNVAVAPSVSQPQPTTSNESAAAPTASAVAPITSGVTASSEFYATFPLSVQWMSPDKPISSTSQLQKLGSFFYNSSSNVKNDTIPEEETKSSSSVDNNTTNATERKGNVQIQINGRPIPQLAMNYNLKQRTSSGFLMGMSTSSSSNGSTEVETCCRFVNGNGLRPSSDALDLLIGRALDNDCKCTCIKTTIQQHNKPILNYGRNLIRYTLLHKGGAVLATAEAHLYLWSACDSVIVSDVDGTVTKSDVRGVFDTVLQEKFQHIHHGICKFYHELGKLPSLSSSVMDRDDTDCNLDAECNINGNRKGVVRFMYLSSRPISIIAQSRKLLVSVTQKNEEGVEQQRNNNPTTNYGLPPGPILCHTGPLSSVLYSELVAKNIYEFKADVLARQVVLPFVAARGEEWRLGSNGEGNNHSRQYSETSFNWDDRLFVAGFGNKSTDAMAYEMAGLHRRDIYIINKDSRIICMGGDQGENINRSFDRSTTSTDEQLSNSNILDDEDWPIPECCSGVLMLNQNQYTTNHDDIPEEEQDTHSDAVSSSHAIELSLSVSEEHLHARSTSEPDFTSSNVDISITATEAPKRKTMRHSVGQSIRAFSSKRTFTNFPSFGSSSSGGRKSSRGMKFTGYDDPKLLEAVVDRCG